MLKIKNEKGNIIFSLAFLNDEKKVEFRIIEKEGKRLYDYRAVIGEEDEEFVDILTQDGDITGRVKIDKKDLKEVVKFKNEVTKDVLSLTNKIIKGEEELIFLPTEVSFYPFILTCKGILDAKFYSPKYNKIIEYLFSKDLLSKIGVNKEAIEGYENIQKKLSKIAEEKLKKNEILTIDGCKTPIVKIRYKELLDFI